jgi:dihydrolipoamide dehydrogenase
MARERRGLVTDRDLDLVVIGGGIGGYVAAIRAAQLGWRAAIVERDKVGGTCLHRGCIPSKALLRSAEVFVTAKRAETFGVVHGEPTFRLDLAMRRKDAIVEQLYKGVQQLLKKHRIEVIHGVGRLLGPSIFSPQAGAVAVERPDGEREVLTPRYTLIATGSRPKPLPGLAFDGEYILSSDHVLSLDELPESLLIVGAGAIGVEWASLLSDLGVRVTLVEFLPQILPQEDAEVAAEAARALKKRGVEILTGAQVLPDTLDKVADGVQVQVDRGGHRETLIAQRILVAIGREPVIDDIGLPATAIQVERGAIVVDEHYRTAESNVFAVGDVIGGLQLAHVAAHEGIHAVETMAGRTPRPIDYTMIPKCTYSRPEVASVGLTEAAAKAEGRRLKVGRFPFRAVGKALVHGDPDGLVKVVADADTDDVLGVHMVGLHATDMISEAGLARVLNATPWEVAHSVHPHPTLSEALGEAALAVDGLAIHG